MGLKLRVWYDGYSETFDVEEDDDFSEIAKNWMEEGDWGNDNYRISYSWEVKDEEDDIIEEGSGEIEGSIEEPPCNEKSEHEWTSEFEGGCSENSGCWSLGGTTMLFVSHCKNCGMEKKETTLGLQYNPGECDTVEYSDPDPDWVEQYFPKDND